MKNLLIATAFIAIASTATAQEATVTTVVTEPTATVAAPPTPPSAALLEQFKAVCASTFKLSENAQTACTSQTPPRAVKSGNTFRNTGIGTEFNTLIRQL